MSSSTISIITICLNSGKTLERTIENILSQAVDGLQYIIIDGGSTDITQRIVEKYRENISVFISEPDRGISDAFNKGIVQARGEIVGIINADDVLMPGTLKRMQHFFAQHDDIDVVHGDVMLYANEVFVKRISPPRHWWYPWRLGLFNHPATFVRKRIYDEYGLFNCSYRYAMDDELFLRWSRSGVGIKYVAEPFVMMHAGGLSYRHAYQVFDEKRTALLAYEYSSVLANIQYYGRCAVQTGLFLRDWLQEKKIQLKLNS